ncbi:MAG TPA: hypothetical protein VLG49_01895 [Rhabdochlamydiaceae bacterium]|nr:hypothetical protein [Rhabdochlamydiaceae bacterium]
MINPIQLDEAFNEFAKNPTKWVPDGVIQVNLSLLQDLGLLNQAQFEQASIDNITHYFHVVETPDKVTLFNQQFAIWIVPKLVDDNPTTLTYVSLLNHNKPHLELVFSTSGVYNTPKYILKILQHFLTEVLDTEAVISAIGKKQ